MTDFEKVIDFNNLYKAFRRAKRGKGFKKSSARFDAAALGGINALIEQLKRKTYRVLAQMAIIEAGMASIDEVFLPYLTDGHGNTLYKLYSSGGLMLGDGSV